MSIDKDKGGTPPGTLRLSDEALRRRKLKNRALLVVLVAFCLLFYLITIVRMGNHG